MSAQTCWTPWLGAALQYHESSVILASKRPWVLCDWVFLLVVHPTPCLAKRREVNEDKSNKWSTQVCSLLISWTVAQVTKWQKLRLHYPTTLFEVMKSWVDCQRQSNARSVHLSKRTDRITQDNQFFSSWELPAIICKPFQTLCIFVELETQTISSHPVHPRRYARRWNRQIIFHRAFIWTTMSSARASLCRCRPFAISLTSTRYSVQKY